MPSDWSSNPTVHKYRSARYVAFYIMSKLYSFKSLDDWRDFIAIELKKYAKAQYLLAMRERRAAALEYRDLIKETNKLKAEIKELKQNAQ